jgi:sugar O-acyltransferase (sialic acid O-acetyltransferase NeuD family)
MAEEWVVVGAGVQGRQVCAAVAAAAQAAGDRLLGFLDDDAPKLARTIAGWPVLGPLGWARAHPGPLNVAIGIGQAGTKRQVVARLRAMGAHLRFPPVIHPFSCVGPGVELGEGVVIQPGSVLVCDLTVGEFTIVGACSSLSHDARVGAYNFLSPGLRLAGYGRVEDDCTTGLNTCILAHTTMHSGSISGAGAVIIRDVAPGATVAGVPARPLHSGTAAERPSQAAG